MWRDGSTSRITASGCETEHRTSEVNTKSADASGRSSASPASPRKSNSIFRSAARLRSNGWNRLFGSMAISCVPGERQLRFAPAPGPSGSRRSRSPARGRPRAILRERRVDSNAAGATARVDWVDDGFRWELQTFQRNDGSSAIPTARRRPTTATRNPLAVPPSIPCIASGQSGQR